MSASGSICCCQSCESSDLTKVVSLGYMPPVNGLRDIDQPLGEETWYPAELLFCERCKLAQIGYVPPSKTIFPKDYPYTSRSTRILRENFADLADDIKQTVGLSAGDLIVDIGSNDGTLLSNFAGSEVSVLGIEPTDAGQYARDHGIDTLQQYFSVASAKEVVTRAGKRASVVLATNVFAHMPRIPEVMQAISELIQPGGVFVSESHYLADLVQDLQYDTIYHEHLRYYSLTSIVNLLDRFGFKVFKAKPIRTHGGSIRVYATQDASGYSVDAALEQLLKREAGLGLTGKDWIPEFRSRVVKSKLGIMTLISSIVQDGGRIFGVGAPSRGSTLVNYVGLSEDLMPCVVEIATSKKLNKYLPGTRIPILDEKKLYAEQPSHAFLLSWHIADELMPNLKRRGFQGDFIVPLPIPRVISNDDV